MKKLKYFLQENSNFSVNVNVKSFDDALQFVNKYCNEWLSEVYGFTKLNRDNFSSVLKKGLWRGFHENETFFVESRANRKNDSYFYQIPRLLRKSINSVLNQHYSVTLDDLFCSSKKTKIETSNRYLCFPLNGYNYAYSVKNIFDSLNDFSNLYYSKICPNFNKYIEKETNASSPISMYDVKYSKIFMNRFKVPFNALFSDELLDTFAKYAKKDTNELLQLLDVDEKAFAKFFNLKTTKIKEDLNSLIWGLVTPKIFCINETEINQ